MQQAIVRGASSASTAAGEVCLKDNGGEAGGLHQSCTGIHVSICAVALHRTYLEIDLEIGMAVGTGLDHARAY